LGRRPRRNGGRFGENGQQGMHARERAYAIERQGRISKLARASGRFARLHV
jgi:hypothetical protein